MVSPINPDLSAYLTRAIRPTLMLLFIESISFFLLRQYRVLVEDFKYFHKLFLKRLNYAQCHQLIKQTSSVKDVDMNNVLVKSLLDEQLDRTLSSGETTEAIENLKRASKEDATILLQKIGGMLKEFKAVQ